MSEASLREVITGNGVVSFDGRVLEMFGFLSQDVHRWHVAEITAAELKHGRFSGTVVQIDVKNGTAYASSVEVSESDEAAIEELLAAVRAASPNVNQ